MRRLQENLERLSLNFMKIIKIAAAIFLAAVIFITDRLLKILFYQHCFSESLFSIGDFFSLQFFANQGIAFSLPVPLFLTIVLSSAIIVALIAVMAWFWRKKKYSFLYPLVLLSTGAVSNYLDRVRWGLVVDYFNLKYFTAFNLADLMITGGLVWLLLVMVRDHPRQQELN